ncbi:DUF4129 domain-containing protein, partial [bacterium]|nr:DUF4129 domain-containing protein [bacterium]
KQVVGFALSLFWVFLALIVLWRISMSLVNWLRLKLSNSLEVEIESIEGAFWADILKLIKAIFNKMVTFVEIVKRLLGLTTKLKMVSPATKSIRHIYRDLLKWAAAAGCHRDTSQTPYEFLHVLAQRYPEGRTGFSIITTSYVNTRYGHHQLSRNQLDELKKQWRHLKRLRYKNKKQFQKGDNGQ